MVVGGARSVLLPTRGGLNSAIAARVVDAVLQPQAMVTVLTITTSQTGVNDDDGGSHQLSLPIQQVLARSPVPLLLVRRASAVADEQALHEESVQRILVPVTGTLPGRAAEEFAYLLGQRFDAQVRGAHVVTSEETTAGPAVGRQLDRAHEVATSFGSAPDIVTRHAPSPPQELAAAADEFDAD